MGLLLGLSMPLAHARAESPREQVAGASSAQPASHARPTLLRALRPTSVAGWQPRVQSALGLVALLGIAWMLSSNRRRVPWRVLGWGLAMQFLFGAFVLKTALGMHVFSFLNRAVARLLEFTSLGARFVFGPYAEREFSFALNVLPVVLFLSALATVLYHLGVMQRIVQAIAWVMQRTMGTSGAETLCTATNIFLGQNEAPLMVRPFVASMTQSELMTVMVAGFAMVAGSVLAAYVGMLHSVFPDIAGHLIAASVMGAPAAIVVSKILLPETETPKTANSLALRVERTDANLVDAAARGASDGLHLALQIGAMLLVFVALVALVNFLLGLPFQWVNAWAGHTVMAPLTLERIVSVPFWPIAYFMGIPPSECGAVAGLLGQKLVLNEFVAYVGLQKLIAGGGVLSYRASVIVTYALCGFANFGSIGIQIGGIGGMAPERRHDLARLGIRAMIGGTLASCMNGAVAGILV